MGPSTKAIETNVFQTLPNMSSTEVKSNTLSKIVNDLGKRFQNRATPQELVQKNILREDEVNNQIASSLVQHKMELESERTKLSLATKISLRPNKETLEQKNILRESIPEEGAPVDSFEVRQTQLKSCLKKRAPKTELENQNILKGPGGAIAAVQEQLKRSMLEDTLQNKIANRPDLEELQERKIILFAETVEVLPTFRKSEYNRKPDNSATFKNLTQQMKIDIREELNNFKKEEMDIHPESESNTCFH